MFLTQGSNTHLIPTALAGRFFTTSGTWEAPKPTHHYINQVSSSIYLLAKTLDPTFLLKKKIKAVTFLSINQDIDTWIISAVYEFD